MSALHPFSILAALGDDAVDIADVFSTDLYTGNGSTQGITNGVDLSGEGGLVWIKSRSAVGSHNWFDTERGALDLMYSDTTAASSSVSGTLTSFNSDGYSLGSAAQANTNTTTYVGWTVRQAAKFFGVAEISHTNGVATNASFPALDTVGMAIIKRTDNSGDWYIWHRSLTSGYNLRFSSVVESNTAAYASASGTTVTLDSAAATGTYSVYAFAHDDSTAGNILCGSYTGNGSSTGPIVTLGWQPQFLMVKRISGGGASWVMWDSARSTSNPRQDYIFPDTSDAEGNNAAYAVDFNSDGFQIKASNSAINNSGDPFAYVAIRAEGA